MGGGVGRKRERRVGGGEGRRLLTGFGGGERMPIRIMKLEELECGSRKAGRRNMAKTGRTKGKVRIEEGERYGGTEGVDIDV